jgi:hypothetical protein
MKARSAPAAGWCRRNAETADGNGRKITKITESFVAFVVFVVFVAFVATRVERLSEDSF